MSLSCVVVRIFSVGLMILGAGTVFSQDYPNKLIRIITATAGGGSDFVSRQIAQGIAGALGQPMIVDNRGAGTTPAEAVSKASADGYTLLLTSAAHWIRPLLVKTPYDVERDFSPISLLTREVLIIAVHPSLPVKSVRELIVLAKGRPGELNYAASAIGSAPHLAAELFKSMAAVNVVSIPYKGSAAAIVALLSGEVQLTITDAGFVAPHVKSGKLRALAVTSAEPSALTPGLPTVAASGLPGYEWVGMTGIWAPAKTPGPIINRLNQEIVRFLRTPEAEQKFFNAGEEIIASSPEQLAATIKSDIARLLKLIKDAGIKLD